MSKKAQSDIGIGSILIVFITVLVGVVLFLAVAQQAGGSTTNAVVLNTTFTAPVNGTAHYFDGYSRWDDITVYNHSTDDSDVEIDSGNYTVANNVINPTTGALAVSITPDADDPDYNEQVWIVQTDTAYTSTYVNSSGGRSMVTLILIFFALSIAVVTLVPVMRSKILGGKL